MQMDSSNIRQKFLDFFESKGHKIVPSAPLVLKNDPSLLFTNSGMVQFKDYFLGNSVPPSKRIADTQKCLRVSGKHNDLEDVGLDTYHHTMFEMLGNWSFGDYFKKEAISWAWELLTEVYGLPKDRLYVTVFGGDKGDNLPVDEEAKDLWRTFVSEEHILHGNKKDNFWEMGESGPCGSCSEIHIDLRSTDDLKNKPGRDLVNSDHPQVVEIWNLVFIQFNRLASGALVPLPDKHVDTGMGFERLCMAIQAKTSNYDTDVFMPLINNIAALTNSRYGKSVESDIAIRVIADHIRSVSFAIADGQLPSNNGGGYVIRRILRRAIRYGYSHLNQRNPFICNLVYTLAQQFQDVFPELINQKDFVFNVILEEEKAFLLTLEKGLKRIEVFFESVKEIIQFHNPNQQKLISGEQAFELYDTFGFPFDLTSLISRERGFSVDEKGFNDEMAKQKSRSKVDAAKETGDWIKVGTNMIQQTSQDGTRQQTYWVSSSDTALNEWKHEYEGFVGYDNLEVQTFILRYRLIIQKSKELFQIVLAKTPFYAESGGQVGDTGVLEVGGEKIFVIDTKKENDLTVHWVEKLPASIEASVQARVDVQKRKLSMSNHSATHLLHAALRQVLGKHVEQKGSLVNEKILRFDFSHFAAMTTEEIFKVEAIVNEKIRENIQLDEKRNVPIEKAKSLGAMALFGEKYGELVRVITFDPKFSVELCGGTHVKATGNIGLLKIVSESSVAAGVRRIEAVTADGAFDYLNGFYHNMEQIKTQLKNPKNVVESVQTLIEEKHVLEKKLEWMYQQQANVLKEMLATKVIKSNGYTLLTERVSIPNADSLKNIAYALRNQFDDLLMILAADIDGKPQVAVMIGEKLELTKKFHAGNMVKELAKEIDGGGGGQPFFAVAGGKKLEGLDRVLVRAKELLN